MLMLPAAAFADCAPWSAQDGAIPKPLADIEGDPERGRRVALEPSLGDCTICHRLPVGEQRFHGTVGPPLAGVGARLSAGELRLRLVDPSVVNPRTVMPAYCTTGDRHRVAPRYAGEPILTAQQIEDLVAWLTTLDGTNATDAGTGNMNAAKLKGADASRADLNATDANPATAEARGVDKKDAE